MAFRDDHRRLESAQVELLPTCGVDNHRLGLPIRARLRREVDI
jgi:hypothetical protein